MAAEEESRERFLERECTWSCDPPGPWMTRCDQAFEFTEGEGGPVENGFRFCPFCGAPLRVTTYTGDDYFTVPEGL
jgi:hypothetical protein